MATIDLGVLGKDSNEHLLRAINDIVVYSGNKIDRSFHPDTWEPAMSAFLEENKVAWITVHDTFVSMLGVGKMRDLMGNYLPEADMDAEFFEPRSKDISYTDTYVLKQILDEIRTQATSMVKLMPVLDYIGANLDKLAQDKELNNLFNKVLFYSTVIFQVQDYIQMASMNTVNK